MLDQPYPKPNLTDFTITIESLLSPRSSISSTLSAILLSV